MCTCTSFHMHELGHRHSSLLLCVSSFMLWHALIHVLPWGMNPGSTDGLLRGRGKTYVYELVWQIGRGIPPVFSHLSVVSAFSAFQFPVLFFLEQSCVHLTSNRTVIQMQSWMIATELHWYCHSSYFDLVFSPEIDSFLIFFTMWY